MATIMFVFPRSPSHTLLYMHIHFLRSIDLFSSVPLIVWYFLGFFSLSLLFFFFSLAFFVYIKVCCAHPFYPKWERLSSVPVSIRLLFWYDMVIIFQLSYSPGSHFLVTTLPRSIHPFHQLPYSPMPLASLSEPLSSSHFSDFPTPFFSSFLLFLPDPLYLGVGM